MWRCDVVAKAKPVLRCSTCGLEKRKLERVKNGWACWRCIMAAVQLGKKKGNPGDGRADGGA
jgi:hypothetical protein